MRKTKTLSCRIAYSVPVWQLAQQLCGRRQDVLAPVRAPMAALLPCRQVGKEYEEEMRLPAADAHRWQGAQLQAVVGSGCTILAARIVVRGITRTGGVCGN